MKISTKDLVFCGIFSALIAVGAFLKIPIPPVPISMQTFFVSLAGIFLGSGLGAVSVMVYICIGLIGIPVFTSGGGIMYIFTVTFGYLLGFVLQAFLTGFLLKGKNEPTVKELSIAVFAGAIVTYIIAIGYYFLLAKLYFQTDFVLTSVLWSFFIIFIPGDIAKSIVAIIVGKKLLPVYKQIRHS
ncbi:MAG: biotin transporter BioY [Bacillota bacterium]